MSIYTEDDAAEYAVEHIAGLCAAVSDDKGCVYYKMLHDMLVSVRGSSHTKMDTDAYIGEAAIEVIASGWFVEKD